MKEQIQICCICKKEFESYGHNAQPVQEGRCCDNCNSKVVIPIRLKELEKEKCPKCENDEGWVLKEEVCIGQDNIEVEVECNHLGCGYRKLVKIDISKGRN